MSASGTVVAAAIVLGGMVGLGACGDDEGDEAAFCDAVSSLRDDDPFADLELASPAEMRDAFDRLDEGAERIADSAPSDARRQAEAYRDSVDELIDQLRGAGFDPRNLDPLAYREATDEYGETATSLDNAADAICS